MEEELFQFCRAPGGDFQPYRVAVMSLRQFTLQCRAQVLDFLLVKKEVGIARHPEGIGADNFHPFEQCADKSLQYRGEQDQSDAFGGDFFRQLDDARQYAWRLDDGRARVAAEGVASLELNGEIEGFVEHPWKRMGRVQTDRSQHRDHFPPEIFVQPVPLLLAPVFFREEFDALTRKGGEYLVIEQPVLLGHQQMRLGADFTQHFLGTCLVGMSEIPAHLHIFHHLGDLNLEELVEIGGDYAEKPQPLKQWNLTVGGLRQHTPVEGQNTELARKVARPGEFHFGSSGASGRTSGTAFSRDRGWAGHRFQSNRGLFQIC